MIPADITGLRDQIRANARTLLWHRLGEVFTEFTHHPIIAAEQDQKNEACYRAIVKTNVIRIEGPRAGTPVGALEKLLEHTANRLHDYRDQWEVNTNDPNEQLIRGTDGARYAIRPASKIDSL